MERDRYIYKEERFTRCRSLKKKTHNGACFPSGKLKGEEERLKNQERNEGSVVLDDFLFK